MNSEMPDADGMTPGERKVKEWRGKIALAEIYRDNYGDQNGRWGKNVRALAGDFGSKQAHGDEAVDVNIVHSHVNTVLPPLWLTEPRVRFRPTTERYGDKNNVERARFAELEINYWIRELDVRTRVKEAIHDAETTNCGYVYIGYVEDKRDVEVDGERVEPRMDVQHRRPFVRRLSPKQVAVEPGAATLEDANWVAICWTKYVSDVASRYGVAVDDLRHTGSVMSDKVAALADHPEATAHLDGLESKTVKVYQVWDKRTKKVITVCDGYDKGPLDEGDWPVKGLEGFPVERLSFNYLPDELFATPEMTYYLPQQLELNAARTSIRKRNNRSKALVLASADVDDSFVEAYRHASDGSVIKTGLAGTEDIRRHLLVDGGLPLDQHSMVYANMTMEDFREISGLGRNQRGAAEGGTATEAGLIEKWVQTRMSNRGDMVRTFYINIVRKLYKVVLQMPNRERSMLIAGQRHGIFAEVRYKTHEIEGEYAIEVNIEPALDDNPVARQNRALANYNLLAADPLVNREKLILDILEAQGINDPTGYLLTLKTPEQEFQLALQGLPAETHERDDHAAHIARHEVQMAQLEQVMDQTPPDSPQMEKLQMAMALMLAHVNDHGRQIQALVGDEAAGRLGQAADTNAMRQQVNGGAETPAELSGQPLDRATNQRTPGGVPTE